MKKIKDLDNNFQIPNILSVKEFGILEAELHNQTNNNYFKKEKQLLYINALQEISFLQWHAKRICGKELSIKHFSINTLNYLTEILKKLDQLPQNSEITFLSPYPKGFKKEYILDYLDIFIKALTLENKTNEEKTILSLIIKNKNSEIVEPTNQYIYPISKIELLRKLQTM